ncbi:hypothetical protein J6590_034219 [Homalodisca vitripennis]|nr:hypothetical protein J6590_034219 [Homalodisca vitripennis]
MVIPVSLLMCILGTAIIWVDSFGPSAGPFDIELKQMEQCEDQGTKQMVLTPKINNAGQGKYIYNSPFWIGVPVDEHFKTLWDGVFTVKEENTEGLGISMIQQNIRSVTTILGNSKRVTCEGVQTLWDGVFTVKEENTEGLGISMIQQNIRSVTTILGNSKRVTCEGVQTETRRNLLRDTWCGLLLPMFTGVCGRTAAYSYQCSQVYVDVQHLTPTNVHRCMWTCSTLLLPMFTGVCGRIAAYSYQCSQVYVDVQRLTPTNVHRCMWTCSTLLLPMFTGVCGRIAAYSYQCSQVYVDVQHLTPTNVHRCMWTYSSLLLPMFTGVCGRAAPYSYQCSQVYVDVQRLTPTNVHRCMWTCSTLLLPMFTGVCGRAAPYSYQCSQVYVDVQHLTPTNVYRCMWTYSSLLLPMFTGVCGRAAPYSYQCSQVYVDVQHLLPMFTGVCGRIAAYSYQCSQVYVDVQQWGNGGYRPRAFEYTVKNCEDAWKLLPDLIQGVMKSAGHPVEKCPIQPGNFTANNWEVEVEVKNIPTMIYGKYRAILTFLHKKVKVGCNIFYAEVVPKKLGVGENQVTNVDSKSSVGSEVALHLEQEKT